MRVLISGYYGFNNSGDDAILKSVVDQLTVNPDLEITVLSKTPAITEKVYKVKAVSRMNPLSALGALMGTDIFISGGGSLLQDVTSTRSIIYYLSLIFLAKLFGKKVVIYGQGLGPINRRCNRKLTKLILERVDLITVRDSISKDFLEALGVKKPKTYLTADPVLSLDGIDQTLGDIVIDKLGIKSSKLICVSVRDWEGEDVFNRELSIALRRLLDETGYKVLLLPMSYDNDLKPSLEVARLIGAGAYVVEDKLDIFTVISTISKAEVLLGIRLHSLIFGAVMGLPVFGISYDPKIDGFLQQIGEVPLCTYEEAKSGIIYEEMKKRIDNLAKIKEYQNSLMLNLKGLANKNYEHLSTHLLVKK